MSKSNNCTDYEENVAHQAERQRRDNATDQYQHLHRGRLRFLRNQNKSALKKRYNRAD